MDIQEARKLKQGLENKILNLLKEYERLTDVSIEDISLETVYSMGTEKEIVKVSIGARV